MCVRPNTVEDLGSESVTLLMTALQVLDMLNHHSWPVTAVGRRRVTIPRPLGVGVHSVRILICLGS